MAISIASVFDRFSTCRWAMMQLPIAVMFGNRLNDWNTIADVGAHLVDLDVGIGHLRTEAA